MTFTEYWTRFRLLQNATDREEKMLKLLEGEGYGNFVRRFQDASSPLLRGFTREKETLLSSVRKKKRLCCNYAQRIAKALSCIRDTELAEYARLYYLYGLTREQVAEVMGVSVRTAYRHARASGDALAEALLAVGPTVKKIPHARFRLKKGALRKKDYNVGNFSHSIAVLTARRKSECYRPLVYAF